MRLALALVLALAAALLAAGCNQRQPPLDRGDPADRALLLEAHNRERTSRGLRPLAADAGLEESAQQWAEYMASRDSLTHSRLKLADGGFRIMGENIAMGYADVDAVVGGWMDSTGHRANILNRKFDCAGFGYARPPGGGAYWCAQFGGR